MRAQVAALKAAAIHACRLRGFPFTKFMEDWGLEEILTRAEVNNTPAVDLAAVVLAESCVTNGKFNNFHVGLLTVLKFLNDTFGPLAEGQQQSIQDLLTILNTGGSYQAIERWMNTHYP
ncbi:MAG TPA: hypothetical protein VG013_35400 [Gemmataceae bacterium]|nr:hypothetical protein [Gemmataceae bacterium]